MKHSNDYAIVRTNWFAMFPITPCPKWMHSLDSLVVDVESIGRDVRSAVMSLSR